MSLIAFLFGEDEGYDFDLICEFIFRAVLNTTPNSNFHVRFGGVLLWRFSDRTTAISRTLASNRPSIGFVVSDDKNLRKKLAVAFAESASVRYHRLEIDKLAWILLNRDVECVSVSDMTLECADVIDKDLRQSVPYYLGCFEVDHGDPLTFGLVAVGLIPFCNYEDGALKWFVPLDHDFSCPLNIPWVLKLPFSSFEATTLYPDAIRAKPLSSVGEKNRKLMSRESLPHAEKVLVSLLKTMMDDGNKSEARVEFGRGEFGSPFADVRKLRDYSLNEQHTEKDGTAGDGRAKAYLFRKLLGITRNDWRFLAEQLVGGLEQNPPNKTRITDYGVQYSVAVPVTGRNGQTKLVTSGWIIRQGKPPFLTTAFIGADATSAQQGHLAHLIVADPQNSTFFSRLYEIAHEHATNVAKEWTPTPMWVSGYDEPISEGECGFAWVKLPDSRTGFSRWLKKNGHGDNGHPSGCVISARTASQSMERNRKYCEAFAQVLRLNGIVCEIDSRYD